MREYSILNFISYLRTHRQNIQCCIVLYTITPFPPHPVTAPGVTVLHVTSSQVQYETTAHGSATRVIAGYEVTRFGVPMIGQYVNTGRGSRVIISPAVPGAQYWITACMGTVYTYIHTWYSGIVLHSAKQEDDNCTALTRIQYLHNLWTFGHPAASKGNQCRTAF